MAAYPAMGRRKKHHTYLPPRLRLKHGAYYHVATLQRRQVWSFLSRQLTEALSLWAKREGHDKSGDTVGQAIDRFSVVKLPTLSEATQHDYLRYAARIRRVFGDSRLSDIQTKHIARYLDERTAKIEANREIAFLSSVYSRAIRWGWCAANPCRGVPRNDEHRRRRYLEDAEVETLRAQASDQMRAVIDLALLTGMRKKDLLKLRLSDLREEGIFVEQSKTGKRQLFTWTDALREVVDRAKALRRRVGTLYLFATREGQPYTGTGFDSIWRRVVTKSELKDVRFHDLRAKAGSDAPHATELLGHDDPRTTNRYKRAPVRVKPLR
jgi:integrase